MYSSGNEIAPEFAETSSCKDVGCTWDLYQNFTGQFAPSIVDASQYARTKSFFESKGLTTDGFIVWKQ